MIQSNDKVRARWCQPPMHLHFPISMSTCPVTGNIVSAKSQSDHSFLSGQEFTTPLYRAKQNVKFILIPIRELIGVEVKARGLGGKYSKEK